MCGPSAKTRPHMPQHASATARGSGVTNTSEACQAGERQLLPGKIKCVRHAHARIRKACAQACMRWAMCEGFQYAGARAVVCVPVGCHWISIEEKVEVHAQSAKLTEALACICGGVLKVFSYCQQLKK